MDLNWISKLKTENCKLTTFSNGTRILWIILIFTDFLFASENGFKFDFLIVHCKLRLKTENWDCDWKLSPMAHGFYGLYWFSLILCSLSENGFKLDFLIAHCKLRLRLKTATANWKISPMAHGFYGLYWFSMIFCSLSENGFKLDFVILCWKLRLKTENFLQWHTYFMDYTDFYWFFVG